jgi:hypothetical protein
VYDVDGELHVVVPEILEAGGYDVCQENIDLLTEQLAHQAAQLLPPGTPVLVPDDDDAGIEEIAPEPWEWG